ncbi:hypothetical protein K438DRAFT_1681728 [Mycena galopus ATCC 62051]|nr:hypothetical protein K438DRAFT_1681728 [Mycena galopus ATCC 62051]
MNDTNTSGLRLLSLDGGGIRGLSMLIILEDLMWKLKVAENLANVPRPCEYFDLIGGTSTGGLMALMLGRLRMTVEEAKKAYGELSKEVFSDIKSQGGEGRFKASKLEKAVKRIVTAHSVSKDPEEQMEDTRNNACKTFVCTMNAANMSLPVLFRTYNTPDHRAMDCTIWQAGRATTATPNFFKQIKIGPLGMEEAFVDGGIGQNNPIAALSLEARVLFPESQIACIISLGTGKPHTIRVHKPSLLQHLLPRDIVKAIKGIAMDCEKEHQQFACDFDQVSNVYFRFNVEQGLQDIQLNQWEKLGDVAAHTRQYILSSPAKGHLADAVKSLSQKIGKVSTICHNATTSTTEFKQAKPESTVTRCPPPSHIFQGRQDILQKMNEYFSRDIGARHVYVLYGLGGSGKTQIALKFLEMRRQCFSKQFFIDASSVQTLDTAFKDIALSQKIGQTAKDASLWLISQTEEWMLLFDNADDPSIDLFPFLPRCTHGNIIITSRNPDLASYGAQSYAKVGDMNETDAIDLLLVRAVKDKTVENTEVALEIVKELSCLPLAVIQAGAYISKFNCLHQYLSIYKQNHIKLLSQHATQSHDDYRWTVYTTWQISFEQLSKAAAWFLQLCCLLHHESIPVAIFEQAAGWTPKANDDEQEVQAVQGARDFLRNFRSDSGTWDTLRFMEVIVEIQGYSLIEKDPMGDTLSIHPLVHSWCQNTLKDESVARDCMSCLIGMSVRLTDNAHLFRIRLISHLDTLIKDPKTIASIFLTQYARVYYDSGRFKEAASLEVNVMEKRKQLLGADHPDTLNAMTALAATYWHLGRYQQAVHLQGLVLEKGKQLLGAHHPNILQGMRNLAVTYTQLGRYQDAEALQDIVLEKRKELLGANHPDTLNAMTNLAATYWHLGRHKQAEHLQGLVLEQQKQLLGAHHPETLTAMANLAVTYSRLKRYQDAEHLEGIVLEKRKQLLGADHSDTLSAMKNMAITYRKLGRHQESEHLQGIVLEKRKQILGADHPDTLTSMANLAATYTQLGRHHNAETLKDIVLEKRKQILGADHPETLTAMSNLAVTYGRLGRYQDAEHLESIVLEKRKQLLGADHPDTASAIKNMAITYRKLGRHQEAEHLEGIRGEKQKKEVKNL